jgi:hypothetical protein
VIWVRREEKGNIFANGDGQEIISLTDLPVGQSHRELIVTLAAPHKLPADPQLRLLCSSETSMIPLAHHQHSIFSL